MKKLSPQEEQEIAERVEKECVRYGLETMEGNHAEALLRHIYANRDVTVGAQKDHIALLKTKLESAETVHAKLVAALLIIKDSSHASRQELQKMAEVGLEDLDGGGLSSKKI